MDLQNRLSGFASENENKFESANSAYKSFINATGDEQSDKPDFKKFLETAKQTGLLDTLLKKPDSQKDQKSTEQLPEKKKFPTTTQVVGIIVGIVVIGTVIYFVTRKKKQS
jgi:hypothetical protein